MVSEEVCHVWNVWRLKMKPSVCQTMHRKLKGESVILWREWHCHPNQIGWSLLIFSKIELWLQQKFFIHCCHLLCVLFLCFSIKHMICCMGGGGAAVETEANSCSLQSILGNPELKQYKILSSLLTTFQLPNNKFMQGTNFSTHKLLLVIHGLQEIFVSCKQALVKLLCLVTCRWFVLSVSRIGGKRGRGAEG